MINIAFVFSVLVGFGALGWEYAVQGHMAAMRWILLLGGIWLIAQWRRWKWFPHVAFFFIILTAAYGLWIGLSFEWMMIGAIGGLLAWDLSDFMRRLGYAGRSDDVYGMRRRHLARVGIVAGLGGLLAFVTMVVHVRLSFEIAVGLVILTVLGLTRLVNTLRRN